MDDFDKAHRACLAAQAEGREIGDATARVIASMYHDGGDGYAFASSGYIADDDDTWRSLFGRGFYETMTADERLLADMLGTYFTNRPDRGRVAGWSGLWL